MRKLNKKTLAFTLMLATTVLIPMGNVKAALQANSNTHYKKTDTPGNWMTNIRKIEEAGNAMGLSETLNSDLTSIESNGIDVHMMRSTEYGAIAILSASGYGNPEELQESKIKTTTGNATGVYFSGVNYELVAGGYEGNIFSGVNTRYYDTYTADFTTSAKVGDALGDATATNPGCGKWHSASMYNVVNSSYSYLIRGGQGLFSCCNYYYSGLVGSGRGVAVIGQGL